MTRIMRMLLGFTFNHAFNKGNMIMGTKRWYFSKGIWGAVVSALSTALLLFGIVDITPAEQTTITDTIINIAILAGQLGGAIMAIYGRIVASKMISIK